MNVNELLQLMVKKGISDIHFKANTPPLIRMNGKLVSTGFDQFGAKHIEELANSLLTEEQRKRFEAESEIDLAYSIDDISRFRINVYKQKSTVALTLRVIPHIVQTFEELHLPKQQLIKLASESRGLILIAGMTGAGKTTTMNSMLDYINENFKYNIITIEDPVEYYHKDKKSSISQREVGSDTKSYSNALKYILRQDPDVIVIGEMRDFEAISAGITLAETGHLVLSTIHTIDAVQTVDRIVDTYPVHAQSAVRSQFANVLRGLVSQRMVNSKQDDSLIPATEILLGTSLTKKLISENKMQDVHKSMEQGAYYGMYTFDQNLFELYKDGKIEMNEAIDKATNPDDLVLKLKGIDKEE
jgi:twitching motility protein PilT